MQPPIDRRRDDTLPFPRALVDTLESGRGTLITASHRDYDAARRVYNQLHDPRPRAIVQSLDPALLAEVVGACVDSEIPLALRGGGHHIGGGSGGDGGVVLDFSPFREVSYCPRTGVCRVQPGARLGDVDRALARHRRVVPTGTVSDTGIAGLTFGGGIGWLVGALGLTCDHLVGGDVMLPDGRLIRAEEPKHALALWAMKGGGGVGIALELRYRTAPMPLTAAGAVVIGHDRAADALTLLFDFLADRCSRGLTVAPTISLDPDGHAIVRIDYCHCGTDRRPLDDVLALFPAGRHQPFAGNFVEWQSSLDARFLPPPRGYWKSCYTQELGRSQASAMLEIVKSAPSCRCSILIEHLHGAFAEGDRRSSAFPLRDARFGMLIAAQWTNPSHDHAFIAWVRRSYRQLDPAGVLPAYSNYAAPDEVRAAAAYSSGARSRLASARRRYDPPGLARRPGAADVFGGEEGVS